MTTRRWPDAELSLPHDGYARFVTEVVRTDDSKLVCLGRIPVESPFALGGTVPSFVLLEFAAQAAAMDMLSRGQDRGHRPHIGFLARANDLRWTVERVPAGALLTASVFREGAMPPLHVYRATVAHDRTEIFRGRFSIYVDEAAG